MLIFGCHKTYASFQINKQINLLKPSQSKAETWTILQSSEKPLVLSSKKKKTVQLSMSSMTSLSGWLVGGGMVVVLIFSKATDLYKSLLLCLADYLNSISFFSATGISFWINQTNAFLSFYIFAGDKSIAVFTSVMCILLKQYEDRGSLILDDAFWVSLMQPLAWKIH